MTATENVPVIGMTRALELLAEVVDEHGEDFVYQPRELDNDFDIPWCAYVWRGCPDCLIAHALHRAGVPVEELAKLNGWMIGEAVRAGLITSVRIDHDAVAVFSAAQNAQDSEATWGQALRAGRSEVADLLAEDGAE